MCGGQHVVLSGMDGEAHRASARRSRQSVSARAREVLGLASNDTWSAVEG